MAYEIPQSLQYKERIVFNLTIEQVLYATVFGLLAFLTYAKLPYSIYARVSWALIPIGIGLMFMFWDLRQKISDFWAWFKFRETTKYDQKMKHYLQLNAIEKECYHIQTKQGEKRVAVLLVEPMNFKIKTEDERKVIIYSFQKLLNALDFPIQFLMFTDDVNLKRYLEELESKVNTTKKETYQNLFNAHKEYLQKITSDRSIVNRRFFIAIQENAIGLDAQLNIINELLKSMNLKSVRLSGIQLVRILTHFFNNPQAGLSKKNLYNVISPERITNNPDHIKVNEYYNRVITAHGYPRIVEEGFLDKIITAAGNFDLSIHVEPFPIESTLVMLNKELQKQRADLFAAEMKHSFSPSLEIQYRDTRGVLDSIQKGEEKLFNVSFYINAKAKTLEELDLLTKTIQSQLNSILVVPRVPKYRMAQGLKSVMPFGTNELGIKRNITTFALSAFFPFTSPFLIREEGGVFLGLNKNKLPIIKDIFNLSNANGIILASSGSGKSYAAKLLISRYLLTGTRAIVIDPQSEYKMLAKEFDGSVIELSRTSETMINPLDPMGRPEAEKRLALMDIFALMFGQLTEPQKAILDKAVSLTYEKAKKRKRKNKEQKVPTLHDLHANLEKLSQKANTYERGTYTALLNRLSMYTQGVFSFLNKQTTLELTNNFTVFNIGRVPKQVKPLLMFLVLEYVYSQMKGDRKRKLLVIDEAWSLLSRAEEEGYIFEIVKTCRKWNLGLLLITQDAEDLFSSRAGRAVLANSSYTLLLRQKPSTIRSADRVFNLSVPEREHLLTASVGQGILLMENDHQEIKITASESEHKIITTKPDEMPEDQENESDDKIDLKKWVYYEKDFENEEQKEFALNNGYTKQKYNPIGSKKWKLAYIKQISNWTPLHTCLIDDTARTFKKCGLNYTVNVGRTENEFTEDLLVVDGQGKKWAIEVETGINIKKHKTWLREKLQKVIAKNISCIIILADAKIKPRYNVLARSVSDKILVVLRDKVPFLARKLARKSVQAHNNVPRQASESENYRRETEVRYAKNV